METRLSISEIAPLVDRREGTIRKWEREGVLPQECIPQRDDRNRRWWTPSQVEAIKRWIEETDRRPGKALPHYKPTPEQLKRHLANQRTSKL